MKTLSSWTKFCAQNVRSEFDNFYSHQKEQDAWKLLPCVRILEARFAGNDQHESRFFYGSHQMHYDASIKGSGIFALEACHS
jgi:hypothetical protein